ncbi:MAG: class I SAM-dependent methyltransferase [Mariprofundales bacterium]|nr:class I SAM-dependent methyltransferase [Mariprofundales bacterium]
MQAAPDHHQSPCDLCTNNQWQIISQHDRHRRPLTTAICQRCGLVSHLPLPDEESIAQYYAKEYRHDYHGEASPAPRRVMRAWRNGQRIYQLLAPFITPQGRIFEVGAGLGCTVKQFQHHGYSAYGIEPNHDFNRYSRQQLRANITNDNLYALNNSASKQPMQSDLVLLIHVIEHFRSPTAALMQIRNLLNDSALLYIECPNITAPFATFNRLFHFAHIHNFSPVTLQHLAKKCGFEPIQQLHSDDHPDIALLLRKTALPSTTPFDGAESSRIKSAIHRYSTVGYHLRSSYLQRRITKLVDYGREQLFAEAFVQRLLNRCSEDPLP